MQDHSKNRLGFVEKLPNGSFKEHLQHMLWQRFKALQSAEGDTELHDVMVKRIDVEDDVWGLAMKLREAPSAGVEQVRSELHDKVVDLVEIGLEERQKRLEKIEKAIELEKAAIERDRKDKEGLIAATERNWEMEVDKRPSFDLNDKNDHGGKGSKSAPKMGLHRDD